MLIPVWGAIVGTVLGPDLELGISFGTTFDTSVGISFGNGQSSKKHLFWALSFFLT